MVTKPGFNFFGSTLEQNFYEDITIESIRQFGIDLYYIPRVINGLDPIYNEDSISSYNAGYLMEFYIKNIDGFNGQGDFLSKFNLEIRDQVTFQVARRVFNTAVPTQVRPNEGDLLYFPLNKKIFVIRFVEHEEIFYQLGKLMMWTMTCELFEYSGEEINTGIPEIDTIGAGLSINYSNFEILTEDGFILTDEDGFPIAQEFDEEVQEVQTQNDEFDAEKNVVIDFSETNPFAEEI
jgi:hypothetical protein